MITPAHYLAFIIFMTLASATPGPNNAMLMASGANFGLKRTTAHMIGVVLGFGLLLTCVGLGLGALFTAFPVLHTALRWIGCAYLLWLAWKVASADHMGGARATRPLRFWEVVAFQWVNPKALIGAVGAIATYAPQTHYLTGLALIVGTTALGQRSRGADVGRGRSGGHAVSWTIRAGCAPSTSSWDWPWPRRSSRC